MKCGERKLARSGQTTVKVSKAGGPYIFHECVHSSRKFHFVLTNRAGREILLTRQLEWQHDKNLLLENCRERVHLRSLFAFSASRFFFLVHMKDSYSSSVMMEIIDVKIMAARIAYMHRPRISCSV